MRHRLALLALIAATVFHVGPLQTPAQAEADVAPTHQLRLATLAPRQSGLGKAFQELKKELRARTDGQVELKMYPGGVAGDEMTVVRKMRVGQMDGALLTSTGLGALVPQVLVLQAPGLITSYPELDEVRERLAPDLEALFDKAGYALISWGDSGRIRIFSKHKVQHPDDLKNVRPWVWRGSPTMRAFIEAAGANAHIPSQSNVRIRRTVDRALYRKRNLVERFFNKLKHFRRVATRYDKLARNFLSAIALASIRLWLRHYESTT